LVNHARDRLTLGFLLSGGTLAFCSSCVGSRRLRFVLHLFIGWLLWFLNHAETHGSHNLISIFKVEIRVLGLVGFEPLEFGPFTGVRQELHDLRMDHWCVSTFGDFDLDLVHRTSDNLLGEAENLEARELLLAETFQFLHDSNEHQVFITSFYAGRERCGASGHLSHLYLSFFG